MRKVWRLAWAMENSTTLIYTLIHASYLLALNNYSFTVLNVAAELRRNENFKSPYQTSASCQLAVQASNNAS